MGINNIKTTLFYTAFIGALYLPFHNINSNEANQNLPSNISGTVKQEFGKLAEKKKSILINYDLRNPDYAILFNSDDNSIYSTLVIAGSNHKSLETLADNLSEGSKIKIKTDDTCPDIKNSLSTYAHCIDKIN